MALFQLSPTYRAWATSLDVAEQFGNHDRAMLFIERRLLQVPARFRKHFTLVMQGQLVAQGVAVEAAHYLLSRTGYEWLVAWYEQKHGYMLVLEGGAITFSADALGPEVMLAF